MNKRKKIIINIISNVVICAVIALLALGSSGTTISVFSNNNKPYYNGTAQDVSLMINVYWGTEYIIPMLDILDDYGAKATFFVGGTWVEKNIELLLEISDRGHEIGNHGYLHRDHKTLGYNENREEILITSRLITNVINKDINLFAPPSGAFGNNTLKVCEELNYKVIMWSKDTIDWRDKDSALVFRRATNNLKSGDFILMHPTEHTMKALGQILLYYCENGIKSITVTNNLQGITL